MNEITIKQLDQGYLVSGSQTNPIAALSNGRDLCDWIAVWSKANVDIFEVYEAHEESKPSAVEDDKAVIETVNPMSVELDYATQPQEPQESGQEPEAVKVPDEPKRASTVIQDAEKIEAKRVIDRQAIQFADFLDKRGADKEWVKASYTDISIELNVTSPVVKSVIDRAKEMFPKLRSVRVMSGPSQGNNFTFNSDIPEPGQDLPDELVDQLSDTYKRKNGITGRGQALSEGTQAVLNHIEKCAKPGERFQIGLKSLASRAGVSKGGIPFYLGKLKEAGLIEHEAPYGGDVFITRLKADEVAA